MNFRTDDQSSDATEGGEDDRKLARASHDQATSAKREAGRLPESQRRIASSTIVVADYSIQHLAALNGTGVVWESTRDRRLLRQALMGPGGIVDIVLKVKRFGR